MLKKRKAVKGELILTRLWKELEVYCCRGCKYCDSDSDEYCTLLTGKKLDMNMYDFCMRITPSENYDAMNYVYVYAEEESTD